MSTRSKARAIAHDLDVCLSRRSALRSLGLGLGGLAVGCADGGGGNAQGGGGDGGLDSGLGGDGGDGGGGDGGDGGDGGGGGLADTGPALADRTPGSLSQGGGGPLDVELVLLSGSLPTDWAGHVWLVHGTPYGGGAPVFLGDGQVLRFDLTDGGVSLKRRTMTTPCAVVDAATAGTDAGFENSGMARMSMTLGVRNFANTALVPMGERMLVTFDAGRPWEIDPDSLEIATPVGFNTEWRSALPEWIGWFTNWPFPLMMSTAHPGVDPVSGEFFSVCYGLQLLGIGAYTEVVAWDGEGALRTWELVDQWGFGISIQQSVHQLAITRDHVIIIDTAFLVEVDLLMEQEAEAQSPDTVIHIVRRADLHGGTDQVQATTLTIPRECVHFLADYDDSEGIVLHVAHNPGADASEFLEAGDTEALSGAPVRSDLEGIPGAATDMGAMARYVVDPDNGTLLQSAVVYDAALWGGPALVAIPGPAQADRVSSIWWASVGLAADLRLTRLEALYADHPYREVALDQLPAENQPSTLVRCDADTAQVADNYAFPAGRVCLSPTFVPREGGGKDEGYIVCTVISDDTDTPDSSGDELWVFDALDLGQGPLARLGHPDLSMPFTLHTAWTPTAAPRTASYSVPCREDHEDEVAGLEADLQQIFEDQVYPAFS